MSDSIRPTMSSHAQALRRLAEDVRTGAVVVKALESQELTAPPAVSEGALQEALHGAIGAARSYWASSPSPALYADALGKIGDELELLSRESDGARILHHLALLTEGLEVFRGTD